MCTRIFRAPLFTIAPKWKHSNIHQLGEWIKYDTVMQWTITWQYKRIDYTWLNGKNIIKLKNTDTKEYILYDPLM